MTRKTTGERMAVMETEIKGIKEGVDRLETMFTNYMKEDRQTHEDFAKKFAGKWTEKGFWLLVGMVVTVASAVIAG